MSFYKEFEVPAGTWAEWLAGKSAVSVDDADYGCFIGLDEYELRMAAQVNGDHEEDVVDAMCCVVGDMNHVEHVDDLSDWYGGSYAGRFQSGMFYAVWPASSNDGITLLAMEKADGSILVAQGFGY